MGSKIEAAAVHRLVCDDSVYTPTLSNVASDNVIESVIYHHLSRASAYLMLYQSNVPSSFFSSTIKNVCLVRREVIGLRISGQYRVLRTDKQKSRYAGKTVETDIGVFSHCTRN